MEAETARGDSPRAKHAGSGVHVPTGSASLSPLPAQLGRRGPPPDARWGKNKLTVLFPPLQFEAAAASMSRSPSDGPNS